MHKLLVKIGAEILGIFIDADFNEKTTIRQGAGCTSDTAITKEILRITYVSFRRAEGI